MRARTVACVAQSRKVAKGGEAEWEAGGDGREEEEEEEKRQQKKPKVGGQAGGRVAAPCGPGGDGAMRRVTLFLNGSPKNGKVNVNSPRGGRRRRGWRAWRSRGPPGGVRRLPGRPAEVTVGARGLLPAPGWGASACGPARVRDAGRGEGPGTWAPG